jgi:acyl dehydratase
VAGMTGLDPAVTVLTDEIRGLIGVTGPLLTAPTAIGADTLRRFAQAVMETDPIHHDDDAARARGYDGIVAPPLFPLHAFPRPLGSPDPLDALADDPDWDGIELVEDGLPPLDLPLQRLLNGGVDAEIFALARVGDTLTSRSEYADISERGGRSGPMVFVVVQTDYATTKGTELLRVHTTMIAR